MNKKVVVLAIQRFCGEVGQQLIPRQNFSRAESGAILLLRCSVGEALPGWNLNQRESSGLRRVDGRYNLRHNRLNEPPPGLA